MPGHDSDSGYLNSRRDAPGTQGIQRPVGAASGSPGKRTLVESVPMSGVASPPAQQAGAASQAAPTSPASGPGASHEGRDDALATGQVAQRGHAMQYYRLHQPAFLDAVRAR